MGFAAPYTYDNRPYYNVENTTSIMPREMFEEHIRLSNPKKFSWEKTPCPGLEANSISSKTLDDITENGLFSRFVFYRLPTRITWHNVFAKSGNGSINEYFANLGAEFFDFYTELKNAPDVVFSFTEEQQDKFNAVFEEIQYDTVLRCNVDIVSSVRRLGLVTFRIAMIFSTLRMMEDGVLDETLTCREDDYENALYIARILLEHIIGVYNTLPHVSTPVKAPADARTFSKQKFCSDLPPQFDTQTFLQAASALAIAPKTAEKYITAWCKAGQLIRVSQGNYSKMS